MYNLTLLEHLSVFAVFRELIGPRSWQKKHSCIHHTQSVTETEVWLAVCPPYCERGIACTPHIQTRVCRLTSTMSHVAKMHLGNCFALKGFAGRRRGMGMGAQICWWCLPWIYVSVSEPFMRRHLPLFFRPNCLFAIEAAVQILAVVVHLLPLWDLPPLPLFPTLHRYTLHLSNA